MTKEKVISLTKYLNHLTDRITSKVPNKHKYHPQTFKAFLLNEINIVKNQLEQSKLEVAPKESVKK